MSISKEYGAMPSRAKCFVCVPRTITVTVDDDTVLTHVSFYNAILHDPSCMSLTLPVIYISHTSHCTVTVCTWSWLPWHGDWWCRPYRIIMMICLRSLSKFTSVICKKQGSYREMEYAVWKLYSYFQYLHVIFTWNCWFTCFLQWNCPFVFIVHGRRHIESFSALTRKRLKPLLRVYAARHKNYAL